MLLQEKWEKTIPQKWEPGHLYDMQHIKPENLSHYYLPMQRTSKKSGQNNGKSGVRTK